MKSTFYKKFILNLIIVLILFWSGCVTNKEIPDQSFDPSFDELYLISNITIVDGDTFHAVNEYEQEITIRILGIDTPELDPNDNNVYEYGLIKNLSCLSQFGIMAKEKLHLILSSDTCYIKFDNKSGIKDKYDRFLCYVFNETMDDVGKTLVELGLARVYMYESFEMRNEYIQLEQNAIENQKGLWICESPTS